MESRTDRRSRFVLVTQQTLVVGAVLALAATAAGVVELDIVPPAAEEARTPARLAPQPILTHRDQPHAVVPTEVVTPTVHTVEIAPAAPLPSGKGQPAPRRTARAKATTVSPKVATHGFATVGVTWDHKVKLAEDEVKVFVRTRDDDRWSDWQQMDYDPDHGPDPGSAEARAAERPGTEAVVVGEVQDVQVKTVTADGATPEGLALSVVDPGQDVAPAKEAPAIDTAELDQPTQGDATLSAALDREVTPKPEIFSRAQWGADESMRDKPSLHYGEVHAGFVHHTVNANGYKKKDVPAIIRGIYAFHTQGRGWSDVGYNFLIDRFGRIWEGKYGGVNRPVVGAHTLGYNDDAFAASAIGNYEIAKPSDKVVDAYARLFAWKLSLHGVRPDSTRQFVTSKYFQAINGHRDAGQTACPGKYLYARIPDIRAAATAYQHAYTGRSPAGDISGKTWPDLVVRDKATGKGYVVRTAGQVGFDLAAGKAATGWDGVGQVVAPGDLDGDGEVDLLTQDSTGVVSLHPGLGGGSFGDATRTYAKLDGLTQVTGVGDLDKDGYADVVGVDGNDLVLFPGKGDGGLGSAQTLSSSWGYNTTVGAGDLTGDGRPDLLARDGTDLYLVPGKANGLGARSLLAGTWSGFDALAGGADLTGDGIPDLVVHSAATALTYVYPGDGSGGLTARLGGFDALASLRAIVVAGQVSGTSDADLVGIGPSGNLRVAVHNGRANLGLVKATGLDLSNVNLILNVGDWNDDGYADLMTRDTSGDLSFRAGTGTDEWAAPVVIATNWRGVKLAAAVGDYTGDGRPDLLAQPKGGAMMIYPGNGKRKFKKPYAAHSAVPGLAQAAAGLSDGDGAPDTLVLKKNGAIRLWLGNGPGGLTTSTRVAGGAGEYDWFLGVGDVDGDGRSDVIARTAATGDLWLLPGTPAGLGARRLIGTGFRGYDLAG